MKTPLIAALLTSFTLATVALAGPRDAQWDAVEDAVRKGLPKSAIEALEPIVAGAMADQSYDEAIKAIGRKIALEGTIQGNRPEEKIVRLQAELDKAPAAMKPAMEAVVAHWYWQYFQRNRWRFLQRTQTGESPGPDIQTWDLARIVAEIDAHFTAALADEAKLKATPVSEYDALFEEGSVPDSYRPTLFDVLAYDALQFYQAGEVGGMVAEDAFELDAAASPIFGPTAEFVAWQVPAADPSSPTLKAVRLFQKLLRFHEKDADPSAYLDADLARLVFGKNGAGGEGVDARYKSSLEEFIKRSAGHEVSARALAALAWQIYNDGEPARARELAQRGVDSFPDQAGGIQCENLIQQITAKSAALDTERVWNEPWPVINITYRNVTAVHLRAVAVNFDDFVRRSRWGLGSFEHDERREILAARPVLEWSVELAPTTDFRERTQQIPAPKTLPPGFYHIVASHDRDFAEAANQISVASVWVSDLALVMEVHTDGRPQAGFVLEAKSGEPVKGAVVRTWQRDREGRYGAAARVTTDANGRFEYATPNTSVIVLAEARGHAISSTGELWNPGRFEPDEADTQTVFFTDRAIYRPGQTIHYKGVSIQYDQTAGKYSALANREITVVFNDPNNKEVARATHRTNDYGSFSGVFTAPRDRLMGRMSIQVPDRASATWFNVEEYKRPKFQVELAAPAEAARLEEAVDLTGTAAAYSGAPIAGATVKWRVERSVQLPRWCWWWQPPETKAIAHGTALTDADGAFKIRFIAAPDRGVPQKNEPVFTYAVHADVTDITGETRSTERVVLAGYTALRASLAAGEWQTAEAPVEFSVRTESLDGEPQAAGGTLTIHALKQPTQVERAPLQRGQRWWHASTDEPIVDPTNPDSWELARTVSALKFKTDATGAAKLSASLKPGIYRAALETKDRFGRAVTARQTVQVLDPQARHYGVKIPQHVAAPAWSVEPGATFTGLWGTGYDTGRAFIELECGGRVLQSGWTEAGRTQARIEHKVTEAMRGGFTLRITYVRENRAYLHQQVVDVPWSNKHLSVKWESFRSKLAPGQPETWTAVVSGPEAERVSAEMVATLYDASLDQFAEHGWLAQFTVFRREIPRVSTGFHNQESGFRIIANDWRVRVREVIWSYRAFPADLTEDLWGYGFTSSLEARAAPASAATGDEEIVTLSAFMVSTDASGGYAASSTLAGTRLNSPLADAGSAISVATKQLLADGRPAPDLSKVVARRNLNETAFFFPQLVAGEDGVVRMTFTMPEALTEWRFLGFAHDRQLRSGFLDGTAVTSKDLMVEPNPPRFLREGDAVEFTVKVSNRTDARQSGKVRLSFADAATLQSVDAALGNVATEQAFDLPPKQSRGYSWRVSVPDGMGFLTYKAVGATAGASDGEEGFLPVLSRRILVSESLPLPVRGKGTRAFEFAKLIGSGRSDTLRSQSLTVQMVSQPAWYAVMALPYLMEYPYECSEQVFNRYYANALARHVAGSDPKIRRIFDLWRDTPALDSPLEKNQDLKSVLLEETPWLREAADESQARRHVGVLFDATRLDDEAERTLAKLADRQLEDGLWAWFPGGRPSEYISLYIVTGFGRLRHLSAAVDVAAAVRAVPALDAWMARRHRQILEMSDPESYVPGSLEAFYLYGRSFFLGDYPVSREHQEAVDFFIRQAARFWLKVDCRQSQAHLAVGLWRFGDRIVPLEIMRSIKERSVSDPELGMFWRDTELSWWWYRAPIETQAMMIEAFAEVARDDEAVEACNVWLLKQKQTQDWKTTKATADAVYALLLRGKNLLASDALVEVALAGETIRPDKVEAGTGFYEQKFVRGEIRPEMGHVTVTKVDDGVSWGSLHWQYLEDMAKVTPHEGTPLKLKKTLWVKETTDKGPVLRPVNGAIAVGDELVVRIELRTDRDMEYVHLKDQRGSGTEPVNVLSRYRFQDGLAYYESTRDTASHFFIEYLSKGTYVFEYSTRVQLRGNYQTGIAEIQCMYAPEFTSHSESFTLEVN